IQKIKQIMKTIKFLLVSLMVMLGTAAFAQDVVIHKTDGTTEVIENADSVVYDVKDYGYYSFNATSTAEIKNLTASDFTKLTKATSEVDCGVDCVPVVAVPTEIAPTIQEHSKGANDYISPYTLNRAGTLTISINKVTYYIYYCSKGETVANDTDTLIISIN
ncbi:MAG: hypothetical protein MJZ60_10555, partial [Bacteroidaceae bacterium]|nr:hypothetical protein [Bacteroidaceae bacterium]